MVTLADILKLEHDEKVISKLAKELGFKTDNIQIQFQKRKSVDSLNLIVDVDYAVGGDANNSCLLEGKLMHQFNIDVYVIVRSGITNLSALTSSIFSLEGDESKINQFLERDLNTVIFNPPTLKGRRLEDTVSTADETIAKLKRIAVGSSSSLMFPPQPKASLVSPPSSLRAEGFEEMLLPENRELMLSTLQKLSPDVQTVVNNIFSDEKKRHQEEDDEARKKRRNDDPPASQMPTSRVSPVK